MGQSSLLRCRGCRGNSILGKIGHLLMAWWGPLAVAGDAFCDYVPNSSIGTHDPVLFSQLGKHVTATGVTQLFMDVTNDERCDVTPARLDDRMLRLCWYTGSAKATSYPKDTLI